MSKNSPLPDLRELHQDLARKYHNVGTKLEDIWRKLTPEQREEAVKQASPMSYVKHSRDPKPPSHLHKFIPEFNEQDMIHDPEHFLKIFKFRALTPLYNQLYESANERPGDRKFAEQSKLMQKETHAEEMTLFYDGEHYGQSFVPETRRAKKLLDQLSDDTQYILVPVPFAAMQRLLISSRNLMVHDIMDIASELDPKNKEPLEKTVNKALVTAASNLTIAPRNIKSSLPEVCALALESKAALTDYLHLLRTKPIVLNQALNDAYFSRKELVRDSQGEMFPSVEDRHLTTSFFDVMVMAVKAIAIWDYVLHLLELIDGTTDQLRRRLAVQELSNTLHLEYRRTQGKSKRMVSPRNQRASKCFKRMTDKSSGQIKVVMKGRPADHTVSDPQLHYILRLCDTDVSITDAVQWMQKLDDHNTQYADDRAKLGEDEMEALGDLAIVVSFQHITSTAITLSPVSPKSGLLFTARAAELDTELNSLKPMADFGKFLVPFNIVLEPQKATGALAALDDFVMEKTGARLGSLYEDLVHDSLTDLDVMYTKAKTNLEKTEKQTTYVPLPKQPSPSPETRLTDRTAKEKTRPADSVYTITSPPETPQIVNTEPIQQFQVKTSTAALFNLLFSKSEARGSISWTDFESAMADLGFSITPTGGSIFTFNPPASMNTRPITLHRPHTSDIEGHLVFIFARRLQRAYGWTAESFSFA